MNAAAVPVTAMRLGWAGLLPFVAAPLALLLLPGLASWVGPSLLAYALAILCFLSGAWWGIALLRRRAGVLVASNAMVIVACLGVVFLPLRAALCLLAGLLLLTVVIERGHGMFSPQPAYYATLRLRLSLVAGVSLILSAAIL